MGPDIESLGVMGLGAGSCLEIIPSSLSSSPPSKKGVFDYQILCFLTHMRDLDALLGAIGS